MKLKVNKKRLISLFLAFTVVTTALGASTTKKEKKINLDSISIISHRGISSDLYKENTEIAIRESLNNTYSNGIETDLWLTKDGEVVLIHDETVNRTSNGKGKVNEMTLDELKSLNFGTKDLPQEILTLAEFLEIVDGNGLILLEIKGKDEWIKDDYSRIATEISIALDNYDDSNNVLVQSFWDEALSSIKESNPNIKIGLLIGNKKYINKLNDVQYDFLNINSNLVSSRIIGKINSMDIPTIIWGDNFDNCARAISSLTENAQLGIVTDYANEANRYTTSNETDLPILNQIEQLRQLRENIYYNDNSSFEEKNPSLVKNK